MPMRVLIAGNLKAAFIVITFHNGITTDGITASNGIYNYKERNVNVKSKYKK